MSERPADEFLYMPDLFADTLDALMSELGIDGGSCDLGTLRAIVAECFKLQGRCHEDLILWVLYGDDERAKTLARVRGELRRGRNRR